MFPWLAVESNELVRDVLICFEPRVLLSRSGRRIPHPDRDD